MLKLRILIMKFIQRNKIVVLGVIVGLIAGYAYYYFVGCASGTCAITSKPINSSLYGSVMGGLLFSMIPVKTKDKKEVNEESK